MFTNPDQSLRELVQLSPLAVLELNLEGKVKRWNGAAERMFGWTEAEVMGRANPIIPPRGAPESEADFLQLLAGATLRGREVRGLHKDGRSVEAKLWSSPIHNPQHEISGVMAILEDISDMKENERKLRESQTDLERAVAQLQENEERMRLALDAAKIGWWDWNLLTGEMIWSDIIRQLMGFPVGSPASFELFMNSVHPDDRETIQEALKAAVDCGLTAEVRYRIIWPDNSLHWRCTIGRVFHDEAGSTTRMLGLGMDLDNHKAADDQLLLQAAALQAAANSIVITDKHGTILWTNPAFSRLTGYSADEVLGKNPRLLSSGTHESTFYKNMWTEICSGKTWQGEVTNRRKDGSLYREEMTITPVRIGGDQITNYIAIKQDISSRKIAEARLCRAEEKYRRIFEDAPIGIFQATPEGKPVSINGVLAQMHGYDSPEQLMAEASNVGSQLFADPGSLQKFGELLAKDDLLHSAEVEIFTRDGQKRWVSANARCVRDADGKVVLHEGIAEDITERKQAEDVLRDKAALQEQLSTIIATVPGAIYSFLMRPNGSTAIPFASPPLFTIFDLTPDSVKLDAAPLFGMIHPDDRQRVEEAIAGSFRNLTVWHQEFRVNHPRRGEVWVEANSMPDKQQDGSVLWHGFVLDITERKQLELQLRQAQRMESVGRLAGGMAHDFNNMMTVVIGYSDVIAETLAPSDPSLARIAKIKDAARRATALTQQLLAFSRLQALAPVAMNLSTHIAELGKMLPQLLGEDIHLSLRLDPNLWTVNGDPSQIDQVLMNLVVNARDAMPSGGELVIETRNVTLTDSFTATQPGMRSGPFAMVRVSDTGTGISPEVMPKIFEPFFTTKGIGKGTGLGLATAYGIVKQSEGFIGASSEVGVGTAFEVYLPRYDEWPKQVLLEEASKPQSFGAKRILLVEDEPMIREITSTILQELGHTVLVASDASEAIRIADQQGGAIDLLLTDVVMPGMNGRELADQLCRKTSSLRVLFVSGYADDIVSCSSRPESGAYFLPKPFTKSDLAWKLSGIFGGVLKVAARPRREGVLMSCAEQTNLIEPSEPPVSVLAIDDEAAFLDFLGEVISSRDVRFLSTTDPHEGLRMMQQWHPPVILLDLNMPKLGGMEVLERILEINPNADVAMLTADYTTESAVQAIQKGACDYLVKPITAQHLRESVGGLVQEARRRTHRGRLEEELYRSTQFEGMVGRSLMMQEIFVTLRRIALHFRAALITGETGTGKELAARALHRLSPVAKGPFVVCNCAAITETLLESELFGYVRGAFTGASRDRVGLVEAAHGGVLFLDEIGEMSAAMQAKLLRVLQNKEVRQVGSTASRQVDVRVVASTHRDLRKMVSLGQFREDLYYRLSMIEISLPRLAERKEDLPLLEQYLLQRYAKEFDKPVPTLTRRAQAVLLATFLARQHS